HRPYTTLGTAASRSTSTARELRSHPLPVSLSRTASPIATGTASTTAIVEVTSVPKINGSAPNCSRPATGFQFRPTRKWRPNAEKARLPFVASTTTMRRRSTTRPAPKAKLVPLNTRSPIPKRRRPDVAGVSAVWPLCLRCASLDGRRERRPLVLEVVDVAHRLLDHRARNRREVQRLHLALARRVHPL